MLCKKTLSFLWFKPNYFTSLQIFIKVIPEGVKNHGENFSNVYAQQAAVGNIKKSNKLKKKVMDKK